MEKICKDLRNQSRKIINYEKKKKRYRYLTKKLSLTKSKKFVIYVKKIYCTDENDKIKFKLNRKVRDHSHYTGKSREAARNICNLRYKIPKEIPIVFHNGSIYDSHFIIKQLAE